MNNPFSRGGYAIQMYIYSFTVFIYVRGLKCRHTVLGNPQTQSLRLLLRGPDKAGEQGRGRDCLGRGAGWRHTCSGTHSFLLFIALTRKTDWEQLRTNLLCCLDQ